MELYQVEQFLSLAQTCNMHITAEKISVTQPALSKNLKKLEFELGCQLFERKRNKLELNEYGKIVLKHCTSIADDIKLMKKEIDEQKVKDSAAITCSGYSFAALYFIMPHLAHSLPDKYLICDAKSAEMCHEYFLEGRFDFIISDKSYPSEEYENIELTEEYLMITIPASYPTSFQKKLKLKDLKKIDHFALPQTPGYTDWFMNILKTADIQEKNVSFYPINEYLNSKSELQMCNLCSSLIIHFVPEIAGKKVLKIDDQIAKRQLYIVIRKKNKKRLEQLIQFLEDENNNLFSNVSFLPYFMFRNESSNLIFK